MRLQDLTPEQQELVGLDFGEEIEKQAQEKVATVQEMYSHGHDKLATEMADGFDALVKQAQEEEAKAEEEKKKEDAEEESKSEEEKQASASLEKTAAELGAFIERGVFDGLQKLGSERHQDPLYYLLPYMEDKVAEAGAIAAVEKFASKMDALKAALGTAKGKASDAASAAASKARQAADAAKAKAKGGAAAAGEAARGAGWGARGAAGEAARGIKGQAAKTKADLMAAVTGKTQGGTAIPRQERARRGAAAATRTAIPLAALGGAAAAGRASKD